MNTSTNPMGTHLMHALVTHFEAERARAMATMQLYLNTSVGVSDHPDIVEELVTATTRLSTAEEALSTLNRNFLRPPGQTEPPTGD